MSTHEELQAFWNAYVAAYRAGDTNTCGSMFTVDAELHSPYAPPARGRDAIEALHATWTNGHSEATDKKMKVIHAGRSGDLAWCLATYTEGLEVGNGTSVDVFERQADGSWLIRMCSLNSTD
ncbi:YybH family protein [Mesorhizobium sp. ES1-4]|uniref:YybH family protein n=1 Tax=Mesorhizobium sp. ES1-4 TaxID=2876627 RepID=UPI001CCCA24C|nr:nuclear transport factor 2 family protein [Mesorhizobium sp. ES1-4]MBZ9796877.1 nuclear transport factor 2 family protein [Mesorhizobium sp. ES1-4]